MGLAWVIEDGQSDITRPLYWAGWIKPSGKNKEQQHWSFNSLDAIRFARADDASKVACWLLPQPVLHRICEHEWGCT